MNKIYVVFGQTGEYSDHVRWAVKAFRTRKKAEDFCIKCIKEVERLFSTHSNNEDRIERYLQLKEILHENKDKHKYDPYFEIDYAGTDYSYEEVELEE